MTDIRITVEGAVGVATICRAPNNHFDMPLTADLADAFEAFDRDPAVHCVLLESEGRHFCAGADFSAPAEQTVGGRGGAHMYQEAVRLFRCLTSVVACVQGAAIGGGLGLSLVADFRVASLDARFAANFSRLGLHPGFGVSVTLPRVGRAQAAALLLFTGRRLTRDEAERLGLVDVLAPQDGLREAAMALAAEIAASAALAVTSMRATLRRGLADEIAAVTDRELAEQEALFRTADFREGVRAMADRRPPVFRGE